MDGALAERIGALRKVPVQVRHADGRCVVESRDGVVVHETERRDVLIEAARDPAVCRVEPGGLLFIGSQDAAENEAGLREAGIAAILNVSFSDEAFPGRFRYRRMPLLDVPEQRLEEALGPALAFVAQCEAEGLRVLVHCNAGESTEQRLTADSGYRSESQRGSGGGASDADTRAALCRGSGDAAAGPALGAAQRRLRGAAASHGEHMTTDLQQSALFSEPTMRRRVQRSARERVRQRSTHNNTQTTHKTSGSGLWRRDRQTSWVQAGASP
jgi:hypothetical protein